MGANAVNRTDRETVSASSAGWVTLEKVGQRAESELGISSATAEQALIDPLSAGRLALRELIRPTGPGYGYGAGKFGVGPFGTNRGRVPRGLTPAEVAALRFEIAPLRALHSVADSYREPKWVPIENRLEVAWFDVMQYLTRIPQRGSPGPRAGPGSPQDPDEPALDHMHKLISSGGARSVREAARITAREFESKLKAASREALEERLRRKYRIKYGGNIE
jgi:hypothetical protein